MQQDGRASSNADVEVPVLDSPGKPTSSTSLIALQPMMLSESNAAERCDGGRLLSADD